MLAIIASEDNLWKTFGKKAAEPCWTEIRWPKRLELKVLSIFFMVAGIFLYPILEIALEFIWPRMVLFGAECPTTIFLIGLFIGSIPGVNKPLFVIVLRLSRNPIVTNSLRRVKVKMNNSS